MAEYTYVFYGQPFTKKNSQQIAKNKYGKIFIVPSKAYKEFERRMGKFCTPLPDTPINSKCNIRCTYYMQNKRKVDLVNLIEATLDILVKHKVLEDDNSTIAYSHDGSSVRYDKEHPRTVVEISEYEAEGTD